MRSIASNRCAQPKSAVPERGSQPVERSFDWVGVAAILSLAFILILGRGITLSR